MALQHADIQAKAAAMLQAFRALLPHAPNLSQVAAEDCNQLRSLAILALPELKTFLPPEIPLVNVNGRERCVLGNLLDGFSICQQVASAFAPPLTLDEGEFAD